MYTLASLAPGSPALVDPEGLVRFLVLGIVLLPMGGFPAVDDRRMRNAARSIEPQRVPASPRPPLEMRGPVAPGPVPRAPGIGPGSGGVRPGCCRWPARPWPGAGRCRPGAIPEGAAKDGLGETENDGFVIDNNIRRPGDTETEIDTMGSLPRLRNTQRTAA